MKQTNPFVLSLLYVTILIGMCVSSLSLLDTACHGGNINIFVVSVCMGSFLCVVIYCITKKKEAKTPMKEITICGNPFKYEILGLEPVQYTYFYQEYGGTTTKVFEITKSIEDVFISKQDMRYMVDTAFTKWKEVQQSTDKRRKEIEAGEII